MASADGIADEREAYARTLFPGITHQNLSLQCRGNGRRPGNSGSFDMKRREDEISRCSHDRLGTREGVIEVHSPLEQVRPRQP